jgi:hypothetical protein
MITDKKRGVAFVPCVSPLTVLLSLLNLLVVFILVAILVQTACATDPSPDRTFQYGFCLSKSTEPSELRYAVTILDGLVKEGYDHQVDCMYGAAVALYLLGEFDKARVSSWKTTHNQEEECLAKPWPSRLVFAR